MGKSYPTKRVFWFTVVLVLTCNVQNHFFITQKNLGYNFLVFNLKAFISNNDFQQFNFEKIQLFIWKLHTSYSEENNFLYSKKYHFWNFESVITKTSCTILIFFQIWQSGMMWTSKQSNFSPFIWSTNFCKSCAFAYSSIY